MKVFIIVLSWNAKAYISKCLDSLQKLKEKTEIVVVDNASVDGSAPFIKKNYPKLKLIKNDRNLGYASGNNIGIKYALDHGAEFVWIVNPDVTVAPDSLSAFLKAAEKYPRVGIFTPKIYFAPGFEFHKERYSKKELGKVIWSAGGLMDWANLIGSHRGVDEVDIGQYNSDSLTQFATGASIFIRRTVFDQVGLIDPKYYLYYEENDFCQRAKKAGWLIMYIADSVAWHANAQATGIGSPLQDYYISRNRMLFGMHWAPLRTKIALIRNSLFLLRTGRPWQRRGVLDFYLMNFGKGSYA
ncbi:MAG: glycosyl transferase family protein [Microgenomates group bacterium Gr01-1014_16]|nr:MAG: glycosyl transferase family protein [Microgenomates group bacterium Gr01-1014_16]